ncbi:MAG: D-alanyl-D-alanine carboxypeptidase, partial [Anaerovorax sp.]
IPMEDLLYGLMLRSGNDAAVAIAEEVGPGTQRFVEKMNRRAKKAGACATSFVNPNGLHDENHYTTAKDMAVIAQEAMRNEHFRRIASAKNWTAKRGIGGFNYFITKNKVVYEYDGGTGIKIGFTKNAGRTLVASAKRDEMELICVVLNAPDWFQDTYKLMDYGFEHYQSKLIVGGERPVRSIMVLGGEKKQVKIGTKNNATVSIEKGKPSHISIAYDIPKVVEAPVSRWDLAGTLKVFHEDAYLYAEPLYYLEDMERKDGDEQ